MTMKIGEMQVRPPPDDPLWQNKAIHWQFNRSNGNGGGETAWTQSDRYTTSACGSARKTLSFNS